MHVEESRYKAVRSVNQELIRLYYYIGSAIINRQTKHDWGSKIIEQLSKDLKSSFPEMKDFSNQNLKYMRKFAEEYTQDEIGQQAVDQLPWGHNILYNYEITDKSQRLWYIRKTLEYGWSRNVLSMQIETKLYEKEGKAVTNFNNQLPSSQSELAQSTFRNPYLFDFLSLGQDAHEREVEKALVYHIEKFLLELGEGFAFLGRQYHLEVENEDYYLDLLNIVQNRFLKMLIILSKD